MAISANESIDYAYHVFTEDGVVYLSFMKYDGSNDKWITIDVARDYEIHGSKLPTDLGATLSIAPELPAQFHDALAWYVIAAGYKKPPNINLDMVRVFEIDWNKAKKRFKRYNNKRNIKSARIIPCDY